MTTARLLKKPWSFAFLLAPWLAMAQVNVQRLDIEQPRSFGYQIGDKFERFIFLQLRKPLELHLSSLPASGRISDWLTFEEPIIARNEFTTSTQYEIQLTYQIVNIDPAIQDIAVPHHDFLYGDGEKVFKALIPATRVNASVVRASTTTDIRPDAHPTLLPQDYFNSALFGALLITSLFALTHLHFGSPSSGYVRPFRRAHRSLVKLQRQPWNDENYRHALQDIHQAFNEITGKIVFVEMLDELFDSHPEFVPIRQAISDFFVHSQDHFFHAHNDAKTFHYSCGDLTKLAQNCHDIERGLA
jgi:mxaA protein